MRLLLAVLILLTFASPAFAADEFTPYPHLDREATVTPGQDSVIRGPGDEARRPVLLFELYIDGHDQAISPVDGDRGCVGTGSTSRVFVRVDGCGRVARITATSLDGEHTVRATWWWRPARRGLSASWHPHASPRAWSALARRSW